MNDVLRFSGVSSDRQDLPEYLPAPPAIWNSLTEEERARVRAVIDATPERKGFVKAPLLVQEQQGVRVVINHILEWPDSLYLVE